MYIEYDTAKNQRNIAKHQLAFDDVVFLEWEKAIIGQDDRKEYGETRYTALVPDAVNRLHVVVFTDTNTYGCIRVISFRKANKREVKRHEQAQ